MVSDSGDWLEPEFARPEPPRPEPGRWDAVVTATDTVVEIRRHWRRDQWVSLPLATGHVDVHRPGRATSCTLVFTAPGVRTAGAVSSRDEARTVAAVYQGRRLRRGTDGLVHVDGMLTVRRVTDLFSVTVREWALQPDGPGASRLTVTAVGVLDRDVFDLRPAPRGATRRMGVRFRGEFTRKPG